MEIKQLKYFVVAADVGSFSEAAKVLYTTQSSVSKVIASLEMELGYQLFKREGKGITLTSEGKRFHNMVKISANHSSWLANCFSDFYELHKDSDVCYSFHADTTPNIINRIRLMEDEVGFVYVFPEIRLQFEYELKKYQLNFEKLKSVDGMVYFQPDDTVGKLDKSIDNIHNMKFIQSEQDEYFRNGLWHTEDGDEVTIKDDIAVITNSDYVMHAFLEKNSLANLSADSFNSYDTGVRPGLRLKSNEGEIQFGIITNDSVKISPIVNEFISYICEQLRHK